MADDIFDPLIQLKTLTETISEENRIEPIGLLLDYLSRVDIPIETLLDSNPYLLSCFKEKLNPLQRQYFVEAVSHDCEVFRYSNDKQITRKFPYLSEAAANAYNSSIKNECLGALLMKN